MSAPKPSPSKITSPFWPQRPPTKEGWNLEDLQDHLYAGMHIELSTIPIYLCAMYSIRKDNSKQSGTIARVKILDIAQQEMLHLTLVGNMYCAVGGTKKIYHPLFIPKYPTHILYQEVPLQLASATKKTLKNFLKIEAPYMQMPDQPEGNDPIEGLPHDVVDKYKSIGQFYEEIEKGIKILIQQDEDLFKKKTGTQFKKSEFFQTEKCGIIDDLRSALAALELIVDQGEGGLGVEDSHYKVFVDLHEQRKDWENLNLIDNPKTELYQHNDILYKLSLAFNAAYCYLLATIDTCWETEAPSIRIQLIRNIHAIMIEAITPLAELIMKQKVEGKHAVPCFEYYPAGLPMLSLQGLFDGMKKELETAESLAVDEATKVEISQIQFSVDRLAPPK